MTNYTDFKKGKYTGELKVGMSFKYDKKAEEAKRKVRDLLDGTGGFEDNIDGTILTREELNKVLVDVEDIDL